MEHTDPDTASAAPFNTLPKKPKPYAPENSLYIFLSFAFVGGFLEAYTYLLHGGVFCNAQTGNLVLLALRLVQGRFADAAHYAYSILAYLLGILVSAALPLLFKKLHFPRLVALLELCVFAALAFIPQDASDWYTYVSVSFLCALQYNTFTQCHGTAVSTTFCTNNLRQTTLHLFHGIREKDSARLKKSGIYALVILFFALGAAAGALISDKFGNLSALFCSAVLLPACIWLFFSSPRKSDTEH